MHKNAKINSPSMLNTIDVKTSTSTVNQEQRPIRTKRRTNDDSELEQEIKKPKRVTRSRSAASSNNNSLNTYEQDNEKKPKRITRNESTKSTSNTIPIPIKQTKKKSSNVKFYFHFNQQLFLFSFI